MSEQEPETLILSFASPPVQEDLTALAARHPGARLFVLLGATGGSGPQQAAGIGASVPVDIPVQVIAKAAENILGDLRFGPHQTRPPDVQGTEPLTRREAEIRALLRERLTDEEIAGKLHIAVSTVRSHVRAIFRKLGITSRRQLADPPR